IPGKRGRGFVHAVTWIFLAAVAAITLRAIASYNALIQRRNRIANAYAQIDVQLKRRYDLIPNLVEVAKRYLAHEATTLEAVTRARGAAITAAGNVRMRPTDAGAVQALTVAEQELGGSVGRLF